MLCKDPNERIKIKDVLIHPWFDEAAVVDIDQSVVRSLTSYRATNKLQKEAMVVLVKFLDIDHLKELRSMFFALDTNKSGTLTFDEVQ
jgi:calcium-dependent protein kinase